MTDNKTPLRPIRIEDDLWVEFGRLVGTRNRSQVIRDFIRWFVRERGAQLPARGEAVAPAPPDRDPELTKLLTRARNNLAHGAPQAMALSFDEAEGLLPRELQILLHVANGLSDAEIATALKIAPRTVKAHVKKIAEKIRVAGQAKIHIDPPPPASPGSADS